MQDKNAIKSNLTSIPCDLGGGAHEHLGLMLTAAEYMNVVVIPYIHPVHPGVLDIAVGTATYEATRLREEHKEVIRLNNEANNVKTALLNQLSRPLPNLYLKSFRNTYSNTFNVNIFTILQHLFTT